MSAATELDTRAPAAMRGASPVRSIEAAQKVDGAPAGARVVDVAADYEAFITAKNTPGTRFTAEGLAIIPADTRAEHQQSVVMESAPHLNDYVLEFRKPGKQAVPVRNDVSNEEWIRWASGVWDDIRETDVLSGWRNARGDNDEKHICPLQLDVIRRCVRLWSNQGETVFTPFLGIGSEVYVAIEQGRRGCGVELKPEYYRQAIDNAEMAVAVTHRQGSLL